MPSGTTNRPVKIVAGFAALATLVIAILLFTEFPGDETGSPAINLSSTNVSPAKMDKLSASTAATKSVKVRSNWIAVLPFEILSEGAGMEQLAQGITTLMIHALSPIPSFSVVPYRTVERLEDTRLSLEQISRNLNARYLLEGRIQQAGDKIRIGIELIDGVLGKTLWQESKTFVDTDILAIQDEVTLQTSRVLSTRMRSFDSKRLAAIQKEEMDASELTFLASNFWLNPNQANLKASIADLRRALQLDPDHADALGCLAHLMSMDILMGGETDGARARVEACQMASQAIMLG